MAVSSEDYRGSESNTEATKQEKRGNATYLVVGLGCGPPSPYSSVLVPHRFVGDLCPGSSFEAGSIPEVKSGMTV